MISTQLFFRLCAYRFFNMISENQGDGCSKLEIESPLHDFTKANVFLLLWKATPENMSAWFRCNFFLDCEYIDFSI